MEQSAKSRTAFFSREPPESGLKFGDNPKIAMKLQMSEFQKHIFARRDLFREKGTMIALGEVSEGWRKSSKRSGK